MVRSTQFCALAALLGAGLTGFIQPVRAQDFPATIPGILCDTEAQVRSIVSANQQSADAMRTTFQQLSTQLNSQNKPACGIQQAPHTMLSVPDSVDIGSWPQEGQVLEAFALHLQLNGVDGWFMYLAPRGLSNGPSNGI